MTAIRNKPHPDAFSLVELLVVISIAAIILALSLPSVRGLLLQGQVAGASTTIAAAADTARRLAKSEAVQTAYPEGARYQGAAMIITPTGEIRMVVNDPAALDLTLNTSGRRVSYLQNDDPQNRYSGFEDIERLDHINLPAGVNVYGIDYAVAPGVAPSNRIFLPPPFAVRFDGDGRLVVSSVENWSAPGTLTEPPFYAVDPRDARERLVVYKEAYNDGSGYEPPTGANRSKNTRGDTPSPSSQSLPAGLFDPRVSSFEEASRWNPTFSSAEERFDLPFSVLETVGAIRIVLEGEDPNDPESGYTDIILSRYSGSPAKVQNP